jgi:uncharacterized protein (DUF736 family)
MRLGIVKQVVNEENKYLEMQIHMAFMRPSKFRLSVNKNAVANQPTYTIYLQPDHPKKGERYITHAVGALWIKRSRDGVDYMSGYIESSALASGKLDIVIYKTKDQEADHIYDVVKSNPDNRNRDNNTTGQGPDFYHNGVPVTVERQQA